MPASLIPSDHPWLDTDTITIASSFTLSVPVLNQGDEAATEHDRILVTFSHDFANDHRHFYVSAPGLEPHTQYVAELHFPGGDIPSGQWQVSLKNEHDSGYSHFHLAFSIDDAE